MESTLLNILVTILLVAVYRVAGYDDQLYKGSACQLEDGSVGVCEKLTDCHNKLLQVLRGKRFTEGHGHCAFDRDIQIVCCDKSSSSLKSFLFERKQRPADKACMVYESKRQRTPIFDMRVNAGIEAEDNEFTYMVALGIQNRERYEPLILYVCGGSLIASQFVLTAAHCVKSPGGSKLVEARIGSKRLDVDENVLRIAIDKMFPHPDFVPTRSYNDIAVVKLKNPVSIYRFVPACLHLQNVNTLTPETVIAAGWGRTKYARSSNVLLRTPDLNVVSKINCVRKLMSTVNYLALSRFIPRGISDDMICAADSNLIRGGDTCSGDSGGPLVFSSNINTIIGITSFGPPCGRNRGTPAVYTAVTPFLEWIESIVWS